MTHSSSIVITAATRTPVGSFNGSLARTPAHDLGSVVIKELLLRSKIAAEDVSEVVLGQVLGAGQGQNPARQASVNAGLANHITAWGVNQVCGSGLRSVVVGAQQILCGDADVIIAGGQENMSMSPHCANLRLGQKMGDLKCVDSMIKDGLTDAFHNYHMGQTAENVAEKWEISREEQDAFAVASQNKAEAAQKAGRFKEEIVPVAIVERRKERLFEEDEYIRHGVSIENLSGLRPAFNKQGSVTAGNASGINDGAAGVVLMSDKNAEKRALEPLARIVSWGSCGVEPALMGSGPIPSSRRALEKAGWSIDDLDLVEANEAFAAQALAVNKTLGWNPEIVNVNGGAIAIGHPIGASGTRVLATLLHEMKRRDAKKGLATLCIGGGMGIALCVARD